MTQGSKIATVFGGTGFVGRQIVRELAARGITIKVATRVPESAYFLKPYGNVGQIVPFLCNPSQAESLAEAVKGADFVVNCIGILFEKGKKRTFKKAHIETPCLIAQACQSAGVKKLVHISALGCDKATSQYGRSKLEGEKEILKSFPKATILRPSVIFGEDDNFFNMFAELSRYVPVLPLIGGGKTKFQPVYVGDVADAAVEALLCEKTQDKSAYEGKVYQLGGPEVLTFKEIYELLFKYTGRRRCLINLPYGLAKVEASFLSLLPAPLLTPDQVESLKTDTIVSAGSLGLERLGINPKGLDVILPTYLKTYKAGGRFAKA